MRISLLLLGLLPLAVADIYSCGGFVKSSVAINYQNVKVKLLSPEGHLKSEEDCNPQNGYYMIPVYNKGKYSLKVSAPEGWHFEKDTVEINIDGETDPCSKNEDVNFVVEAFSITGTLDDGNGKGQAGIDLVLKQNGNIVQKTVTGNDGKYSFKAKPGKYEVSTSDSTDACIARKAVQVSVVDKPVVVQPSLSISGYSLSINVKNKGKGVAGVPITVFASNSKLSNCVALKTPVNGATHSCSVGKTSADGSLQISCLPFGKYRAVAKWDHEGTHFTFAPAEADFEISNAKKSVDFTVSGFSARGRVVSAGGQPLEGVTVKTSSGQTVTTDKKGYYELSLQEGQLELKASAPHTQFTTVSAKIQLPTVQIPDISVNSYEVCGNVEKSGASYERLILSKKGSSDSVSIQPSGDGSFCKFVKVGTYTISPADSSSSLTPRSLEVDVNKGPVEGLRFTHFKTDADARVTCIGNCGPITLVLSMGNTVVQRKEGADVTFQDIGPGQYTVKLEDGGRGCWENKELTLTVERSSLPAIHFVQSGLVTNVKLSHKAHLKWSHADKKQIRGELDAVAGVNSICVPVQGQYNIEIKSCYTFSPASLEVSVPTETIVEAKATDAQISGAVKGGDNTMIIKVKSSSGERDIPVQNGVFTFRESLLSADQILLVPSSPVYLFEPQSHSIAFHGDCLEKAAHFDAQKGIFIDGKIQPPVKDVKITAVNNRDKNVELKAISDAYGHFRLGPVRKAEDLTITALLDGYSFTPKAGKIGVIDSVKLSKLTVVLTDSVSHERLEDVLLSLVGGSTGYRSNSKVESNGEINFVGLAPGEYFVRPILQEYKFEPSTHTISVKEGEHQHLTLEGKRVSYSVYGKVREMSKAPVTGVPVEALSEQCEQHQSEAVTGQDGQFRIRGLRPGCSYRVSTKHTAGASNVHCFPSSFTVSMPSADVKGLEMVAAPQDRSTMVAVEIDFGTMIQPTSYKVSVTRSGNVVAQQVITAPVIVFHYEMNRDGAEYSVRVEADRPHNAFKAKTVIFTADSPVRVVRVPITASTSKDHVEISLGSFLALPFFGILALIFLNQNKALEIVRDLCQQYKNGSASPATERKRRRM